MTGGSSILRANQRQASRFGRTGAIDYTPRLTSCRTLPGGASYRTQVAHMSVGKRGSSEESSGSSGPKTRRGPTQPRAVGDAPVTTILQTKLRPPATVPGLVARPRLIEGFKQNPRRPLTLVSAPAGYGKTTLVTQWLQATEAKPAWFSLGGEDGDLRTFLSYLVATVEAVWPGACEATRNLLDAQELPPTRAISPASSAACGTLSPGWSRPRSGISTSSPTTPRHAAGATAPRPLEPLLS